MPAAAHFVRRSPNDSTGGSQHLLVTLHRVAQAISHLNVPIRASTLFSSLCQTLLATWPLAGAGHCLGSGATFPPNCRVALVHCSTCLLCRNCSFDRPPLHPPSSTIVHLPLACCSYFPFFPHDTTPSFLACWSGPGGDWVTASGDPVSGGVANRSPPSNYPPLLQLPTGHSPATGK